MISLEKTGNAIKFTFDNNGHYLQDGTIEVPVNSLTLVTDDSDMFTFKKSATNDIFVSGLYSEIGMSKSELETFYKDNMVGSTGGGSGSGITSGEVQTMIDESISGKADAASAVTNVRILTVSQQNSLQIEQRINNDYQFVGNVYKIGSGLTWDYSTKEIEVDNSTVALKTDLSGKLDASAYTPVTIDSAITSNSRNAVQSSAIYDKVTITVEESGSTGGTYQNNLFTFDYSDGVTYFSAGSVNSSDLLFASGVKYKSSASGEEITINTNGETDDYIYNYAGKTITVTLKGNNRLVSVNASTTGTDGFNYSYNYTNSTTQWLKDYVSALEARVKILEQNNA